MGIKIVKRWFGRRTIYYFCDRCHTWETEDWTSFKTLCGACSLKRPSEIRPQFIGDNYGYAEEIKGLVIEDFHCSICDEKLGKRSEFSKIDCAIVCTSCISEHPDTLHDDFSSGISEFFLKESHSAHTIVRHCYRCATALVINIEGEAVTFNYYQVGSAICSENPINCARVHPSQDSCTHDWLMISGSKDHKGASLETIWKFRVHPDPLVQMSHSALLTNQRHWCSNCGLFRRVPSERLPIRGYN